MKKNKNEINTTILILSSWVISIIALIVSIVRIVLDYAMD